MNMSFMSSMRFVVHCAVLFAAVLFAPAAGAQVTGTKHDLSITGSGTMKSITETQVCRFCHRAHNANPASPLWGHTLSNATYTPYQSGTLSSTVTGTETGGTKLCLSCHDGQVAVNALGTFMPDMASGVNVIAGASNLGTSFSADHPVSFTPNTAGNDQIVNPTANSHA